MDVVRNSRTITIIIEVKYVPSLPAREQNGAGVWGASTGEEAGAVAAAVTITMRGKQATRYAKQVCGVVSRGSAAALAAGGEGRGGEGGINRAKRA